MASDGEDEPLAQSKSTSSRGDGMEILIEILKNLNAKELREARLVCRGFNEMICTNPELFWAKNRILVNIQPIDNNSDNDNNRAGANLELEVKWAELNTLHLVTRYLCPNLHLHNTDLTSLWANKSCRSYTAAMNIEHLKLTRCGGGNEALLFMLVCAWNNLRHLEITDFSDFKLKKRMIHLNPDSLTGLDFPYLATMVLKSQVNYEDVQEQVCRKLPLRFLQCIIRGAPNLQKVELLGWSPETCQRFLQLLASLPPEQAGKLQSLEIYCIIGVSCPNCADQYLFLSTLKSLKLPSLRKVIIENDRLVRGISGLNTKIIVELTHSVETFLESSSESLEIVKLINCPISNRIFGLRMDSFPKLSRVDTRGTLVTELDWNVAMWQVEENPEGWPTNFSIVDHWNIVVPEQDPPRPLNDVEDRSSNGLRLGEIIQFVINALTFPIGLNLIIWIFSWAEWLFKKYPWLGVTMEVLAVAYLLWLKITHDQRSLPSRHSS